MKFPSKKVLSRFALLRLVFILLALVILGKAVYVMTVQRDFWDKVNQRFVVENKEIPAKRGNILADDGQILAASIPEYKMFMDFMSWEKDSARNAREQHKRDSVLESKLDTICEGIHRIFPDISPEEFAKTMRKGRERKSHHWPLYSKRITYIEYCEVKKLPVFCQSAGAGGFHVETYHRRKNPFGRLAIRTIGDFHRGKDSARCGLELGFDSILSGKPGVAHRKKVMNRFLPIVDEPAQDGYDVQTTLNVAMQDVVEKHLREKLQEVNAEYGLCILMEVKTGDVKAISTLSRVADGNYYDIANRAISQLMEPGSVFKPMSFLVAFDDGKIRMDETVDVGCGIKEMHGRKMKDANWSSGGYGVLTVPQVLQKSSNVGVSTLIDRNYMQNPEAFIKGIERIGVMEDLKIPIPGYARPTILRPTDKSWSAVSLPWMSIGYVTQLPPITTITFYNGIANGGKMLRPRFVKSIQKNGEVVKEYPVVTLREHMAKAEAVGNIQECLRQVVALGTGKRAASRYFSVSGKTGTAQIWDKGGFRNNYLISFAGYFPSEAPQYTMIVCMKVHGPSGGGTMCAPVFKKIAENIMAQQRTSDYATARDTVNCPRPQVAAGNNRTAARVLNGLGVKYSSYQGEDDGQPAWGSSNLNDNQLNLISSSADNGLMPDVHGYGLRDAVFRLESLGLKVRVKGVGYVTEQSVRPGAPFKRGDVVVLNLAPQKAANRPKAAQSKPAEEQQEGDNPHAADSLRSGGTSNSA